MLFIGWYCDISGIIERPGCVRQRNVSLLKLINPPPQPIIVPTRPRPLTQPSVTKKSTILPNNFVIIPMPHTSSRSDDNTPNVVDSVPTPTSDNNTNTQAQLVPTHPVIQVSRQAIHDPRVWQRTINSNAYRRNLRSNRRFDPIRRV